MRFAGGSAAVPLGRVGALVLQAPGHPMPRRVGPSGKQKKEYLKRKKAERAQRDRAAEEEEEQQEQEQVSHGNGWMDGRGRGLGNGG